LCKWGTPAHTERVRIRNIKTLTLKEMIETRPNGAGDSIYDCGQKIVG
jgi:hypothetical protein